MAFVTSRDFILPEDADELAEGFWFNLWTKRLFPYHQMAAGDILYWYESPKKRISWKSRVREVHSLATRARTK